MGGRVYSASRRNWPLMVSMAAADWRKATRRIKNGASSVYSVRDEVSKMEIRVDTKCSVGDNHLVSIANVEIPARKGSGRSLRILSALSLLLALAPAAGVAGPLVCIGQVGPVPIFNPAS